MDHGVRKIKEKRAVLVLLDEFDRFLGVSLGQGLLVGNIQSLPPRISGTQFLFCDQPRPPLA